MSERLFGTDGLRGQVNIHPMTAEMALRLGLAAGNHFRSGRARHKVVIGKDTRLSGYLFEYALSSGFCASGMDVFLVGPLPTPAIAFLTRSMRADVGVVISASHNPYMDNGIKFFDRHGHKLPDLAEDQIARRVLSPSEQWDYPAPENIGRAFKIEDSPGRYNVYLKSTIPAELTFDGLTVVMDCANGAAYRVSPLIFEELGAKVLKIGVKPDGININHQVGSLYPEVTAQMVRESGADIGIALDGDADRVIVVDEKGNIVDGDQIMAICAQDKMSRNDLPHNLLVSTVMSNMALELFMHSQGGRLLRTQVGDRYVFEAMLREGASLGGEQSGHIIFKNHATTGDGTLAALQLLRIMLTRGKPLSELAKLIEPFPQILVNVRVERKIPFDQSPAVTDAVRAAESALAGKGRILLRYSGTEPLARVMVEGQDPALVKKLADSLALTLKEHLR